MYAAHGGEIAGLTYGIELYPSGQLFPASLAPWSGFVNDTRCAWFVSAVHAPSTAFLTS
jgi:hypothetical protein